MDFDFIGIGTLVACFGSLLSGVVAFLSYKTTKSRIDIEKELNREFTKHLKAHYDLMHALQTASRKDRIKSEVNDHLDVYQRLLNEVMTTMPEEKKIKVYPAINQSSDKGKVAYISKLIQKSLALVTA